MGWHTVYWTFMIMISQCVDLFLTQRTVVGDIHTSCSYKQSKLEYSLKLLAQWTISKQNHMFSISSIFLLHLYFSLCLYFKLSFGIWSVQNHARGKKIKPQQKTMRSQPATSVGPFRVLRNLSLKMQANGFDRECITGIPVQLVFLEASGQSALAPIAKPAGCRALVAIRAGAGILPPAIKQLCNSSTEILA